MVITLEIFLKNRTIWHYLENISNKYCEILLYAKLFKLKTFQDFIYAKSKTFKDINFF